MGAPGNGRVWADLPPGGIPRTLPYGSGLFPFLLMMLLENTCFLPLALMGPHDLVAGPT